ncbi:Hypothetical predicted protein [Pelobates cultripes]|uniref:Uncharacterized protein n=1 Tax=Pelobates cultripes TaxID=61616 RepID=A0AAD1WMF6_PELCU|nr:Hypothetical predicted protein [Pelobates cultripes]
MRQPAGIINKWKAKSRGWVQRMLDAIARVAHSYYETLYATSGAPNGSLMNERGDVIRQYLEANIHTTLEAEALEALEAPLSNEELAEANAYHSSCPICIPSLLTLTSHWAWGPDHTQPFSPHAQVQACHMIKGKRLKTSENLLEDISGTFIPQWRGWRGWWRFVPGEGTGPGSLMIGSQQLDRMLKRVKQLICRPT